jgi:ankyrin repeat protein
VAFIADMDLEPTLRLPQNFAILPMPSDQAPSATNLPFCNIEHGLLAHSAQSTSCNESQARTVALSVNNSSVRNNDANAANQRSLSLNEPTIAALDAVIPKSTLQLHFPNGELTGSDTPASALPLYWKILFCVGNNFAGLEDIPIGRIIQYLQAETNQKLYQILSSIKGHSARAIIQNVFKGAIESGDHRIIDMLLDERSEDLDFEEQFLYVDGRHWTPIERAVSLRYIDVVKVLLKYHADVNRVHRNNYRPRGGALNCAIYRYEITGICKVSPNVELLDLVLNAGGYLSPQAIHDILTHSKCSDSVYSFMCKNIFDSIAEWSKAGVFCAAIRFLEEGKSTEIITLMKEQNADFNQAFGNCRYPDCQHRIIDVASKRGSLKLVRLLRSFNVALTNSTLACAVASGSEELVRALLFEMEADPCGIGYDGITPLAAAIKLQNLGIIKLLKDRGAYATLDNPKQLKPTLIAAMEVSDIHFIEYLMDLGAMVTPADLGYALISAIRSGREEAAKTLINAGADTNNQGSLSLAMVLKHRKSPSLLQELLDADANPNFGMLTPADYGSSLQLAVQWGDFGVVKSLIYAGADPNYVRGLYYDTPLTMAVSRRRKDLFALLLEAGAEVNRKVRSARRTALWAASKNEDFEMVRELLELGADTDDEGAVEVASKATDQAIFNLIIEKHSEKHRRGYGAIGFTLLRRAIDEGDEQTILKLLQKDVNPMVLSRINDFGKFSLLGYAIYRDKGSTTRTLPLFLSRRRYDFDSVVCESARELGTSDMAPQRLTALLLAIKIQDMITIQSLIRHGANVNLLARGTVKRTPLQQASEVGNMDIIKLLISYGAEVNAPPAERGGGTALQLAASKGHARVVEILLENHAVVNDPGSKTDGLSALECASSKGRMDVVQILLNNGAGSKISRLSQIHNSISLARSESHFAISDLLSSHLEAQSWRNNPGSMDYEEPSFSMDVESEQSIVPLNGNPQFTDAFGFDSTFRPNADFSFGSPFELANVIGFDYPFSLNEQMQLDDTTCRNQSLVSRHSTPLFNDNDYNLLFGNP